MLRKLLSGFFIFFTTINFVWACTGIQLKANDGSIVNGRTIEFGLDLNIGGVFIPRNYQLSGTLPDGTTGLTYTSKYAELGGSMFGEAAIADGINEKGLAIGAFYFPGYAGYATITADNKNHGLSPTQFPTWVLSQFATIDEVKAGIKSVVIAPTTPKGWPVLPPFHYVVYDKTGKSIVIEPVNGKLIVHDNPLGVLTNSPTFDWHMTNLSNYINLSTVNVPSATVKGMQLQQFGEGSGLHGLPGDFTPPSRFVRAAVFSSAAIPAADATQTVFLVFHILNQFDIPKGSVRQIEGKTMYPEYTLGTIARDLQNLKFYFKTYDDQSIRMIDMKSLNMDGKNIQRFSMTGPQQVLDVTKSVN